MSVTGNVTLVGDYGNPSGSGHAKMSLPNTPDDAHATIEAALATYHAALVTAQLTGTAKGECSVTYGDGTTAAKPGASVNVDRKLVVEWSRTSDSTPHRHTISGVPASSTAISTEDAGDRLNATGKTALAAALNAYYGYDDVVVITGKVLQKA